MSVFARFYQKGKRILLGNAVLIGGFTYILVIHAVWMNIQSYNTKVTGESYKRIPIIEMWRSFRKNKAVEPTTASET